MFKYLIHLLLLVSLSPAYAQDANQIMQKAFAKCQSVQHGQYEMTRYMKYMSGNDTSVNVFVCTFKKLKDDTLFSSAFNSAFYWKGKHYSNTLYTGQELVNSDPTDSTATIIPNIRWSAYIKSIKHNYTFYNPLTSRKSAPLLHDSELSSNAFTIQYKGEENLNGIPCYHIQINEKPENQPGDMMIALRMENHYWIRKSDFIPIQYSMAFDGLMNNDTMYQYEKFVLNKYKLNNLKDESGLKLNAIPAYYKTKDYVPSSNPEPLAKDSMAPAWELYNLHNEKISLKSLQGKLVLIDFFYKACYPCMLALPGLQALHEKYSTKGLQVIGIDPYDKKEDDMASFLAKRGVTYPVLLNGNRVANDYHVYAYPTVYLIDKSGKILFTFTGYSEDVDRMLEDIIKNNL